MQFVHGMLEACLAAELLDELERGAHVVEGRDFEHLDVVQSADHPFVLVLGEQRLQHGAGLRAVFGEYITLLHVVGALAPGQRRPVEGDVADQVEGVEVLAHFIQQRG